MSATLSISIGCSKVLGSANLRNYCDTRNAIEGIRYRVSRNLAVLYALYPPPILSPPVHNLLLLRPAIPLYLGQALIQAVQIDANSPGAR